MPVPHIFIPSFLPYDLLTHMALDPKVRGIFPCDFTSVFIKSHIYIHRGMEISQETVDRKEFDIHGPRWMKLGKLGSADNQDE